MPLANPDKVSLFAEGAVSTARLIAYLDPRHDRHGVRSPRGYLERLRAFSGGWSSRSIGSPHCLPMSRGRSPGCGHPEPTGRRKSRTSRGAAAGPGAPESDVCPGAQNDRLKNLLDVQKELGLGVQLARLIDIDLDPFRHRIVLDAGSAQIDQGRASQFLMHTASWGRSSKCCRIPRWPCWLPIRPTRFRS